ncbi:MAG: hypothetical protein Q7T55_14605 [Solirubrobacteraceae bacterium]|nr:hypothetical protein [Solirubrobacteraceae bacterium]
MTFAGSAHSPRTRVRAARMGFATVAVLAAGGATVAFAADRRPDLPPPAGASVATVTVTTPEVLQGGLVQFTGTGFKGKTGAGETVAVKIDDGGPVTKDKKIQEFVFVTANADGTISGSVDLSKVHPDTPINAGPHWLRFLTGSNGANDYVRSLTADFTITLPPGAPTPTPVPVATDPGPGPAPGPGGVPAPTPIPAPAPITDGKVRLTFTNLETKKSKVTVSLKSGSAGSAGTIRIVTKKKFKIGKAKKKQQVLFKSDSYLVEPVSTEQIKLSLTKEGKALFKTKKQIEGIVQIRDASEEGSINQPVVIKR